MQAPSPTDRSTRMPAASLSLFQAMPIPCHRRSHRYRRVAGLVLAQPNEAAAPPVLAYHAEQVGEAFDKPRALVVGELAHRSDKLLPGDGSARMVDELHVRGQRPIGIHDLLDIG